MITATYRSLSSRLHEHVKASGVIKEGVVYIGGRWFVLHRDSAQRGADHDYLGLW
jgi:hypothetical protein